MLLQGALLLFVSSFVYASANGVSSNDQNVEDSTNQPCEGQNCQSEDLNSRWNDLNSIYFPEDDESYEIPEEIESHYEETNMETHYEDSDAEFCDRLKSYIIEIENMHPDLKHEKVEILQKFIHYYIEFAAQWNKCYTGSAAMQLMDIIIKAAQKVKSEYTRIYEEKYPESTKCGYVEEILAEEDIMTGGHISPGYVGSVRGVPGVDFPNYTEVPLTSFSCADKFIPGFYADPETRCQVFHVCYEHRRESFLCPIGTTFNQPILACDYWYSSNCTLASSYYDVNVQSEHSSYSEMESTIGDLIGHVIEGEEPVMPEEPIKVAEGAEYGKHEIEEIVKFFPVKAEVYDYSEPTKKPYIVKNDVGEISSNIFDAIISSGTKAASKARDIIEKIPEPAIAVPVKPIVVKTIVPAKIVAVKTPLAAAKLAAVPIAKLAIAKAAIVPVVKVAADVAAVKAALPLKAKLAVPVVKVAADVAAVKAALPLKAKLAVPVSKVAVKAAIPVVAKTKIAAAVPVAKVVAASAVKVKAVPLVKSAAIPVMKAKIVKSAAVPLTLTKAKVASKAIPLMKYSAIPVIKGKAALLSPLTKKALALGYVKLLKAKKLRMMG